MVAGVGERWYDGCMSDIYIIGHRNPDMDSVCSAWAYAHLKQLQDRENRYIPLRCGNLNEATRAVFEHAGVPAPGFVKDVHPRLAAVVRRGEPMVDIHDPIATLMPLMQHNPAAVGVRDGSRYAGLLSSEDVNRYFLKDSSQRRPTYHFEVDNIPKVIPGRFLKRGTVDRFEGPIGVGAMKYEVFCRYVDEWKREGVNPVWIFGDRDRHLQKVVDAQAPCIILTGAEFGTYKGVDLSSYTGTVFVSDMDTSETNRLLRLSVPVSEMLGEDPPHLQDDMLYDEAKNRLHHGTWRALPVFHGDQYVGLVSRRCFMETPRTKVIQVDHNEWDQSVPGIEEAQLVEVIDHHRVDGMRTASPILVMCEPVGSTCTIIWDLYRRQWVPLTKVVATILLSGITSDTVALKSPTTTKMDRDAVHDLAQIAGVADYQDFATELFSHGATLAGKDPQAIVESDFKTYREQGRKFGIGQCEVTTLKDVGAFTKGFFDALATERSRKDLDFALLMITDVVDENSLLLASGMDVLEPALAYQETAPHVFLMPGVLSRKKQLLPEIIRVLEEGT